MYGICVFDILRTMASLRTIQEIPIYSIQDQEWCTEAQQVLFMRV